MRPPCAIVTAGLLAVGLLVAPARARADAPSALLGNVGCVTAPWTSARPDGHAPIGVMLDHAHGAGEMMVGVSYRSSRMQGLASGWDSANELDVLDEFSMAPRSMRMRMYGLSLMWAPADVVTVAAMTSFARLDMEAVTAMGSFRTTAGGLADTQATTIWRLLRLPRQQLLVNVGVRFPTGSIDETDRTPMGPGTLLAYPMQPGSGSYALLPGVTYVGQTADLSWGAQGLGDLILGKNDRGWRRGHAATATAWLAHRFADWMSASGRIAYAFTGNVVGADAALDPTMSPSADPGRQARHRVALLVGVNLYVPRGQLHDLRLGLEGGIVPSEWVVGPQLRTASLLTVGMQYGFAAY